MGLIPSDSGNVTIIGQPITVKQSANPLPVSVPNPLPVSIIGQPISVDVVSLLPNPLPVSFSQPITVTQSANPLPIDISAQSFSPLVVTSTVIPPTPIGTPVGRTIGNVTNTAYISPNDIFLLDLSPIGTSVGDSVIFRIMWSAIDGGKLSFTLNSTDFVVFNDGFNVTKNAIHLFDIIVDHADIFNLQFSKSTTITFLRVVQII